MTPPFLALEVFSHQLLQEDFYFVDIAQQSDQQRGRFSLIKFVFEEIVFSKHSVCVAYRMPFEGVLLSTRCTQKGMLLCDFRRIFDFIRF